MNSDKISQWINTIIRHNNIKTVIIPGQNDKVSNFILSEFCKNIVQPIITPDTIFKNEVELGQWCIENAAKVERPIIIGTVCKNEMLIRSYHKHGRGLGDIFPCGDIFYSTILSKTKQADDHKTFKEINHLDLQWADRENSINQIITKEEIPSSSRVWFKYTISQKEVLAKVHHMEKQTRHKKLVGPIYKV